MCQKPWWVEVLALLFKIVSVEMITEQAMVFVATNFVPLRMEGQVCEMLEGYLWTVTWLDGRIWTEINVLTYNLIWLGGKIWIETLYRPEILLYQIYKQ